MLTTGKEEDLTVITPMLVCRPYYVSDFHTAMPTADKKTKQTSAENSRASLRCDDDGYGLLIVCCFLISFVAALLTMWVTGSPVALLIAAAPLPLGCLQCR
jgi:hypothetical protein